MAADTAPVGGHGQRGQWEAPHCRARPIGSGARRLVERAAPHVVTGLHVSGGHGGERRRVGFGGIAEADLSRAEPNRTMLCCVLPAGLSGGGGGGGAGLRAPRRGRGAAREEDCPDSRRPAASQTEPRRALQATDQRGADPAEGDGGSVPLQPAPPAGQAGGRAVPHGGSAGGCGTANS